MISKRGQLIINAVIEILENKKLLCPTDAFKLKKIIGFQNEPQPQRSLSRIKSKK
ncbi:MAG: hypothetical protein GY750_05390 [Lentisphaerae bacterium]|nr:hypothetical protein [Lentisphaerota bacterium]MCP4100848.1 hypothetical protein [Lentisphaerota bacterium]